jgi:hypothetical protein
MGAGLRQKDVYAAGDCLGDPGRPVGTAVRSLKDVPRTLVETFHPYPTMVEGLELAALTFDKDVAKLSCCAT